MKLKNVIYLSLLFGIQIVANAQFDKTVMKDGHQLIYKSKAAAGSNASIVKYCDTKGANCQELLITKTDTKMWLPFAAGPAYNIIKTGKTANFSGMNKNISDNNKLVQYYNITGNSQTIITPLKSGYMISYFEFGSKEKVTNDNINIFKRKQTKPSATPECNTCVSSWQDCYITISVWEKNNPSINSLLKEICDEDFKTCNNSHNCHFVITNVNTIIAYKDISSANSYQIAIK